MNKFISKNKKKIIIAGAIIALFGAGYLVMSYRSPSKDTTTIPDQPQEQPQEQKKESNTRDNNSTQAPETKVPPIENTKVNYLISGLNKKDGDIFSIPDEVTFTISPNVDKSKITLTSADGVILFTGETDKGEAKFTVYPQKKVMEGSQGTLLVEGFVGGNIVVTQKVKVVF